MAVNKLLSSRSSFYGLVTGLLGMILCMGLPLLILHQAISPGAVRDKQGWWAIFSGPTRPLPVNGYDVFLPAEKTIALNPDFKRVTTWILWFAPADTLYKVQFSAEAFSRVTIDGKLLLQAIPKSQSRQVEERWRRLSRGPHLIRLDLENNQGGGWYSIGFLLPPLMRLTPLQGEMVAMPRMRSLVSWWWIMRISRPAAWFFALIATLSLLAFLLPLTIINHWYATVILLLLVVIPPAFIPDMSRREPYIGPLIHKELRKKQPRFVFIGNSMLWSRIDDSLLENLLGGIAVYSIVNFGGLSGIHYLALKYLLAPSGIRPSRVFIFFRGTTLVEPGFRTTGPYFETLVKRISPAPDPVFEQLAHGKTVSSAGWFRGKINRLFPVQENSEAVQDIVRRVALWLTGPGSGKTEQDKLRTLVNKRFALQNVGAGIDQESLRKGRNSKKPDFNASVDGSFLPAIIRLAGKHDLPLVFVRVQERPPGNGPVQDTPEMQQFMAALKNYLSKNGVDLYDFTGDPDLPLSLYGQGDHIKDPKQYTPLFFDRLRPLLQ